LTRRQERLTVHSRIHRDLITRKEPWSGFPNTTSMMDQKQFQPKGFWSTAPKAPVSKETQDLLKVMMAESRLTAFQRRQLSEAAQTTGSLPQKCPPTSSKKPTPPHHPKTVVRDVVVNPKNCDRGIRLQEDIEASGCYERERYRTIPCSVRTDKDKEKFANMMAYGMDLDPNANKARPRTPSPLPPEEERDRFTELVDEIEERKNFLSKMTALGKGKEYQTLIQTEISQRIREMEEIDRQKTREDNDALCQQMKLRETQS